MRICILWTRYRLPSPRTCRTYATLAAYATSAPSPARGWIGTPRHDELDVVRQHITSPLVKASGLVKDDPTIDDVPDEKAVDSTISHSATLAKLRALRNMLHDSDTPPTTAFFNESAAIEHTLRIRRTNQLEEAGRTNTRFLASSHDELLKATRAWLRNRSANLPAPSQLLGKHCKDGYVPAEVLSELIWLMLDQLVKRVSSVDDELELEILRTWHHPITRCAESNAIYSAPRSPQRLEWPHASAVFFHQSLEPRNRRNGVYRLQALWPELSVSMADVLFSTSIAMFCYFMTLQRSKLGQDAHHFVEFASRILYKVRTFKYRGAVKQRLSAQSISQHSLTSAVDDLHSHVLIVLQSTRLSETEKNNGTSLVNAVQEYFINDLGRMQERGIYAHFKRTWDLAHRTFEVLRRQYDAKQEIECAKHPLPQDLMRNFLLTAFRLGNTKAAMRIWAYMNQDQFQLTIKDWTTMMHGVGSTGDARAAEIIWHQMLEYGIEPDNAAWNARIQASMLGGRCADGLQMINDLSQQMTSAPSQAQDFPRDNAKKMPMASDKAANKTQRKVQPTTRTLNTALYAIRNSHPHHTADLLKWAASIRICHDVYTFNILLSIYRQAHDHTAFYRTLREMTLQKVKPDAVTMGLLLDCQINDQSRDHDEITEVYLNHLQHMLEQNIQPSYQMYAKLVKGLLNRGELDQARRIFEQSKQAGRSVHARLCATMAEGVFGRSFVDTAVIEDMAMDVDAAQGGIGSDFYDVVLYGLAERQDFAKVQEYLRQAYYLGLKLSWRTLLICLRTTIESHNYDIARKVVEFASQSVACGAMNKDIKTMHNMPGGSEDCFWLLVERSSSLLEID